jgi:hypothetical protein
MVSGAEAEMSLGLVVVEEGREAVSWLEAVNIQPPARPAETISDVIISAKYHLSLFMFARCNI